VTASNRRFLTLFALANAAGFIAFIPLLTLVLPAKIGALAGDFRIEWLAAASLAGAVSASVGNVAFGWASDVIGTRRKWAACGLVLTLASYLPIYFATSALDIVVAVIGYQIALNMLLAPLTAWAADVVPDSDKGLLGGLLAAGPAAGAIAGAIVTLPLIGGESSQLALICLLVFSLAAPLLTLGAAQRRGPVAAAERQHPRRYFDFGLMWIARLLVQIAGAVLFTFLLYYFQSSTDPASQFQVALLSAATLLVAFPLTLLMGRISDRVGVRRPFLLAAVVTAATGLLIMALQQSMALAMIGYAMFGCATASFLALHSAFSMQLLPSPGRYGRDLGVLNLTNTLPNMIAPALAIWLVPGRGFGPLLTLLACLMLLAGFCILLVRSDSSVRRPT
jgi:MFS family permease